MNFRKISERGGGHFRSKKFHCNFFALETVILVMNFRKNFKKGGGHFRSEKFHCKFSAGATSLSGAVRKFSGNSSVFVCTGFPKPSLPAELGQRRVDLSHSLVLSSKDSMQRG